MSVWPTSSPMIMRILGLSVAARALCMNDSEVIMHKATDNQVSRAFTHGVLLGLPLLLVPSSIGFRAIGQLVRRVHTERETKARKNARDNQNPCVQR
jgi:hypothetical protein